MEDEWVVRVSRRRKRSMVAFREHGRIVVEVPGHLSASEQQRHIPPLVARFREREESQAAPRAEAALTARARELYEIYVAPHAKGPEPVMGVRWVSNQNRRWGSCTAGTGEIRITDRLREVPTWVLDYVILHEVAHFEERHHNARFYSMVDQLPDVERAKGFLMGLEFGSKN